MRIFDQRRAADGVDPERPPDAPADLFRQRIVEQREERLRSDRRHFGRPAGNRRQSELFLRDPPDLRLVRLQRRVDVDQRRDVLHHRRRQPLRDRVPVPLHEHEGDHRLQHHHRHDDDQQRPRVEALRHQRLERVAEALVEVVERGPPPSAGATRPSAARRCRCRARSWRRHQPVADAAHGLHQQRIGGIALDLAAQPVDLHVDGALADRAAVATVAGPLPASASRVTVSPGIAGQQRAACRVRGR